MADLNDRNGNGVPQRPRGRFLARLSRDTGGNVLAIMAAALIPLIGLVGSGVDMSRGYMTQSRLQQACDAGVLAGRRAMTNGTVDAAVVAVTEKFFKFNFADRSFGTSAVTYKIDGGTTDDPSVHMSASTMLPTTLMKVFGQSAIPVSVDCRANHEFTNTDIMFVLDVTGSMNCKPGEEAPTCPNGNNNGADQSGSKIEALRAAAKLFYKTITSAAGPDAEVRFGFVPYSQTVNVGKLLPASYLVSDKWTYQSRQPSGGNYTYASYGAKEWDVSGYVAGNTVSTPSEVSGKSTWAGCVEERLTTGNVSATTDPKPLDLDIDGIPTTRDGMWKPYWPEVYYWRYDPSKLLGKASAACPVSAKRMDTWTQSDFNTYVDALRATGGTYHDTGLAWGGRLMSPTGIFKADNPVMVKSNRVQRHMIFMTDGQLQPQYRIADAWGVEINDMRVTGTAAPVSEINNPTNLTALHRTRVGILCNAIKDRGIHIWVVAFATGSIPQELIDCADSPANAKFAANTQELANTFKEIAQNIGALRITQ